MLPAAAAGLVLLSTLLWMLSPQAARAQACCGANNTTDFGVVAPHAWATAVASLAYRQGFGAYDANGDFIGGGGLVDQDLILRLGGGIRLPLPSFDRLQVQGNVPIRLQHRDLDADAHTAVGVGDAAINLRWTAVKPTVDGIDWSDSESLLPLWDLFVGTKAPSGAAPGVERHPSQADVFGNGAWELSLGTKLIKSLTVRHVVSVRAQYDLRFSSDRIRAQNATTTTRVDFRPADQLGLRLEWLYNDSLFLTGGLFAALRVAGDAEQDGVAVPDSAERLVTFGGQVTYAFDYPNWDVTVGVNSDAFWPGGGVNIPFAGVGVLVTLRRTFIADGGHEDHHHEGHHHEDRAADGSETHASHH